MNTYPYWFFINNRFNIIYGKSTSAQYADLAEKYTTDQEYEVGTVIVISLDESGPEGTASFAFALFMITAKKKEDAKEIQNNPKVIEAYLGKAPEAAEISA